MPPKKTSSIVSPDPSPTLSVTSCPCSIMITRRQSRMRPNHLPVRARPAAETHKDEPEQGIDEDEHDSGEDSVSHESKSAASTDGDVDTGSGADLYSEPHERTPEPSSGPCTRCCGRCCCHNTSPEPQHCVRCHTDNTAEAWSSASSVVSPGGQCTCQR